MFLHTLMTGDDNNDKRKPPIVTPSLLQEVHGPAVETTALLTQTSEDAKPLKVAAQFN